MPSNQPPPKDNGGQSKSQPPKTEVKKNEPQPEKFSPVVIGVFVVVFGIVLYAYFGV